LQSSQPPNAAMIQCILLQDCLMGLLVAAIEPVVGL